MYLFLLLSEPKEIYLGPVTTPSPFFICSVEGKVYWDVGIKLCIGVNPILTSNTVGNS